MALRRKLALDTGVHNAMVEIDRNSGTVPTLTYHLLDVFTERAPGSVATSGSCEPSTGTTSA